MSRLGPALLLSVRVHHIGDEDPAIMDIGGMLHKSFQLVGDIHAAVVEIEGTIDPAVKTHKEEPTWMRIGTLTAAEPYKHHTGFLRWVKARVVQGEDGARFGVAVMGEE